MTQGLRKTRAWPIAAFRRPHRSRPPFGNGASATFHQLHRSTPPSKTGAQLIATFHRPHHSRPPSKTGARSISTFRHQCHRRANGRPRGRAVGSRGGSRGARLKAPHRPSCRRYPRRTRSERRPVHRCRRRWSRNPSLHRLQPTFGHRSRAGRARGSSSRRSSLPPSEERSLSSTERRTILRRTRQI